MGYSVYETPDPVERPVRIYNRQYENQKSTNRMEELLQKVRERYVEGNGQEPPKAFMESAREKILRDAAKKSRDDHREIYDALADE